MQQEQWTKGVWWKFDGYELFSQKIQGLEQTYIRPCLTSSPQAYDPWLEFRQQPAQSPDSEVKRRRHPPYQELIELIEDIDSRPRSKRASLQFDPESKTKLLEWCSGHGLLGILPHICRQLTLAPVWKPLGLGGQKVKGALAPHVKRYARTATGWEQSDTFHLLGSDRPQAPPQDLQPGKVVAPEYLPSGFPVPAAIVQTSLLDVQLVQERVSTISNFFPSVPMWDREKFQYPMPLSADFWRMYAEPLEEFLEAARALAAAVRSLSTGKREWRREERQQGAATITALTAPVMVSVYLDDEEKPRQQLASASLLSSYAFMAMLDLTRGTVYECKNQKCGRIYISDAWQSQYCSTRCKFAEQKREQRRNKQLRSSKATKTSKSSKRLRKRGAAGP